MGQNNRPGIFYSCHLFLEERLGFQGIETKTHGFRIIAAWPGTLTIFPYFFVTFTFLAVGSLKLLVFQNVSHLECQVIYTICYDFLEIQL